MPRLKLRGRLIASFFLLILIALSGFMFYLWLTPKQNIADAPQFLSRRYAGTLAPLLVELYTHTDSWENAERYTWLLVESSQLTTELPVIGPAFRIDFSTALDIDRAILTTPDYVILADSDNQLSANTVLPPDLQAQSVPLLHNGQTIGHFVVFSPFGQILFDTIWTTFSRIVTSVAAWAALISIIVSIILAQQISQPLRTLDTAARTLAAGKSPSPLPVTSQDEIGSLTATFNEMADALARQKQLRQQLVADIAHELRTPLAVMQLEIEALEDGLQSAAAATSTLKRKVATLDRLITDLRLLSLADAQELQLELTPIDPQHFLTELVQSWQTQANTAQITLTLNLESTLPPIYADEQRLYQIFQNLINNALHYTPPNGRIEIGGRDQGHELTLWVTDTGSGISPDQLPHIFNRFYRADKSRSRETGGSGLGLAITQRLVALHHGHITAESTPKQGTTFYLTFPTSNHLPDKRG